jgi:hypothetical protein
MGIWDHNCMQYAERICTFFCERVNSFMTRGEGYAPRSYAYAIRYALTVYKYVADMHKCQHAAVY